LNKCEEIWETIHNEVAYLHNGSLDARKGSLAEQAANVLTPFVEDLLRETQAEAWDRGAESVDLDVSWYEGCRMFNLYRSEPNV